MRLPKLRLLPRLLAVVLGLALAVGVRAEGVSVAALTDAGGRELLVYAPVLRDRAQAEAFRRAVVERGVVVLVLTEPESALEAASYVASLALVGARVYLARVPRGENGLIVVDGRVAASGAGVGRPTLAFEWGLRLEDPRDVAALRAWFLAAVSRARLLSPEALLQPMR